MRFIANIQKQNGENTEEIREAGDRFELARAVRKEGGMLVSVREASMGESSSSTGFVAYINGKLAKITLPEKIIFASNLAAMIKAGLPLARALAVFERQTKNPKMLAVVKGLSVSINAGSSLNAALAKYPDVFTDMFVAMVAAGEESGNLPQSLKILADQYEKSYALRKKVRGAMMYPAIVITAMIIIGIILSVYVVPTLLSAFTEMNATLPLSTRILLGISSFISNHYFLLIGFIVVIAAVLVWFGRTEQGKRVFSRVALFVPVIGPLAQEMNSSIISRSLSSLLSSGVDVVESLNITKKIVGNVYYKDVLTLAAERVQKGSTLSSVFKEETKLFPVLVGAMAEVGEETGKLADMLMNVAVYYEDDVDAVTKNISTIIEPVLMAVVGAGVGFFAISIISPLYSIGQQIQ